MSIEYNFNFKKDPCFFEPVLSNGAGITSPSETILCFDNIPFDESVRTSTVATLQQLISLYSFTDIAVDSGAPYNMKVSFLPFFFIKNKVNLTSGVDAIAVANYTGDWAFQSDLVQLFNQLNDGHTLYYSPAGYQK
jgi:hypothetical protein